MSLPSYNIFYQKSGTDGLALRDRREFVFFQTGSPSELTNPLGQVVGGVVVSGADTLALPSGVMSPFTFDSMGRVRTDTQLVISGGDIQIGAVEIKDSATNQRAGVTAGSRVLVESLGSVFQSTSPWVTIGSYAITNIGSVIQSTNPWIVLGSFAVTNVGSVTQNTNPWIILGSTAITNNPVPISGTVTTNAGANAGGMNSFFSPTHYTASVISASGILLVGTPETYSAEQISRVIRLPNGSGAQISINPTEYAMFVSNGSVLHIPSYTLVSGTDVARVEILGTDKAYDLTTDTSKTTILNPDWSHYVNEQIINATSGTAPASVTIDMLGYANYSMQVELGSPGGSVFILYTNDTASTPTFQDLTWDLTGSAFLIADAFVQRNNIMVRQLQVIVSGAPSTSAVYMTRWY